jgi:hypothetical protein
MNIYHPEPITKYGPGIQIELTGEEVAIAIHAWLVAHGVFIDGARTIRVNGELCQSGGVYVDPSGNVIEQGRRYSGRGGIEE